MIEPTRLLHDAYAPDEAASLLRSLSAPSVPSMAKQAELAAHLASLAKPALVATLSTGTAVWVKAALVLGTVGLASSWGLLALRPSASSRPAVVAPPVARALPLPPVSTGETDATMIEPSRAEAPREPTASRMKGTPRDRLAEEESLLEQARKLASASPGRALGVLNHYQSRFPNGQLAAERMFLSVDVLTRLGSTRAARKQADALVRAFPGSVYAAQIRARSPSTGD